MTRERAVVSAPVADVAARSDVLRRLELEVRRRIDGVASGDHATLSVGPGSERAGARAYAPGDDARLIDWNLTARSAETYVRQTEADRESETWIVADRSASLDFGTARCEKRDVVLGAVAGFGMLRLGGGNRVGVVVSGTGRLVHRPARQGRAALMTALAAVHDTPRQDAPPTEASDLAAACRWVQGAARRRGQVVVVSDFLDAGRWQRELRLLSLRHEVVAVHVTDPRELELPDVGILAVVDAETGRQRYVHSGSRGLRERYAAAARQRDDAIRDAIHAAGAEYLPLSTSRDWLTDTVAYASRRRSLRTPSTIERVARASSAASSGATSASRPGLALR
ncbi:MAG: DUF58 domain-containing protein [Actinomycetales bacterium]|nr:DUF58 domain-containing protein [Actinomycetales bacterium]